MAGGRPAKFETAEELDNMINNYFESLKYIDDDNRERMSQPAISDLAYELGFCSRQSIYDYKGKDEFSYSIKRALLFIEGWHEKNSCGRNPTGSIFIMKNMGWKDKHEVDNTNHNVELELTEQEKREAINKIVERQKEFDDYK